jgi:hypothetical protein
MVLAEQQLDLDPERIRGLADRVEMVVVHPGVRLRPCTAPQVQVN